jgi:RNA-splicing ligase RtcB
VSTSAVDAETEYLSPTGWRKISEYDGGKVMEYSAASGHGRFVTPEAYIVKPRREFYGLHTAAFVDEIPAAYKNIDQVMADAAEARRSVRHCALASSPTRWTSRTERGGRRDRGR